MGLLSFIKGLREDSLLNPIVCLCDDCTDDAMAAFIDALPEDRCWCGDPDCTYEDVSACDDGTCDCLEDLTNPFVDEPCAPEVCDCGNAFVTTLFEDVELLERLVAIKTTEIMNGASVAKLNTVIEAVTNGLAEQVAANG